MCDEKVYMLFLSLSLESTVPPVVFYQLQKSLYDVIRYHCTAENENIFLVRKSRSQATIK